MDETHPLNALRTHPIFELVANLERFLGVGRDLITMPLFLSFAAGMKASPVNVEVVTDTLGLDLLLADRLISLKPDVGCRIDTYKQFQQEERRRFQNRAVLLIRRRHAHLQHDVISAMARCLDDAPFAPSTWLFSERNRCPFLVSPTLRLVTRHARRNLAGFAANHASREAPSEDRQVLRDFLDLVALRTNYSCPFRQQFDSRVDPLSMLLLERLLQVFAHSRRVLCHLRNAEQAITLQDYHAARALLVHLPLAPVDRTLSAHAISTAERIHERLIAENHQISLPDRSVEGNSWFTRGDASRWTGHGYTTVKKHLAELEGEGILVSTLAENNRDHGRIIHFRFADGQQPPFAWTNPYDALPKLV